MKKMYNTLHIHTKIYALCHILTDTICHTHAINTYFRHGAKYISNDTQVEAGLGEWCAHDLDQLLQQGPPLGEAVLLDTYSIVYRSVSDIYLTNVYIVYNSTIFTYKLYI